MQGIYIDKELKEKLLNDPINEQYMDLLHTFNKKLSFLQTQRRVDPNNKTSQELEPKFAKILDAVLFRLQNFLMEIIKGCKDIALVRKIHKDLIKVGFSYHFFFKHRPSIVFLCF